VSSPALSSFSLLNNSFFDSLSFKTARTANSSTYITLVVDEIIYGLSITITKDELGWEGFCPINVVHNNNYQQQSCHNNHINYTTLTTNLLGGSPKFETSTIGDKA
jgi:hypothetical protein